MESQVLGIEGGGTRTTWVLCSMRSDKSGSSSELNNPVLTVLESGTVGATNMVLKNDAELLGEFRKLPKDKVDTVGIFLAGCLTPSDKSRLRRLGRTCWPLATEIVAGSDCDSTLAGAIPRGQTGICVNAGTGSCVIGVAVDPSLSKTMRVASAGGKGHIIGDEGSAYWIGLRGLKAAAKSLKTMTSPMSSSKSNYPSLIAQLVLRDICGGSLADLAIWSTTASKAEVAGLCPAVFEAYNAGDANAKKILEKGAKLLAGLAVQVAAQLPVEHKKAKIHLRGSVFERQPMYKDMFDQFFNGEEPSVVKGKLCGAIGAALLASNAIAVSSSPSAASKGELKDMARALTEQRNPRSLKVDQMSPLEIVELFVNEEDRVKEALWKGRKEIAQALELLTSRIKEGGRLFYVGAGTSGRLGVLDASEIPPTFGEPTSTIQGIIAGGLKALYRSVEGAEDVPEDGAQAIMARGVKSSDVVCGIGASGRTPFVLGALQKANDLGCATIFLTCNPARDKIVTCSVEIDLETGPELVTGSTRLKAGTATKVCINILTTGAMILMGRVKSNLMVSLQATNEKLQDRAARLVSKVLECDYEAARLALEANNWDIVKLLPQS